MGKLNQEKIIRKRMNDESEKNKYTDEYLRKKIRLRFKKLKAKYEKDIWIENGVFFIDDDDSELGFDRFTNIHIKDPLMDEIEFLIRVIDCC